MSESSKKQNFLHGAALLAIATALVKVIGALYKIPLRAVIGDQGYGYFITAYDIYSVLLLISNAGLPIAMSRMISQATSLGRYNQVRRIYKVSRTVFIVLGTVSTLIMVLFCHQLAAFQKQPNAWAAILCLGPCALIMAIMCVYRGFFQGQSNMGPTSVSQVLEALFKLLVGLAIAVLIMKTLNDVPLAAGGAIIGVTVGCLVAMVYLFFKFRPAYKALPQTGETPDSYKVITKNLLAIAVPITIGSAGLQMLTVLETNLYMGQLLTANGLSQQTADITKGIYNMSQTIFNLPCAFIIPITVSVLPAVTSFLTLDDHKGVCATEESAARITGLLSLPCAVGLFILGGPVMSLLGGYDAEWIGLAGTLMSILGICVFPYAIIQYTNSLLQAHGYAQVPVINMLVCGVVKLAGVYLLVGNPALGIVGAPICAVLSYGCIAVLNLLALRKLVPQRPKLFTNMLRPLLPAAIMGAVAYGIYWALQQVLGADGSRVILCGVPILIGAAVYFVAVVVFKAITREDCQLLPKGDKIAKLLHL